MTNKVKFELSRKSIGLIVAFVALLRNVAYAAEPISHFEYVERDRGIVKPSYDSKIKMVQNLGETSVAEALESILEDARGTCTGSLRCMIATTSNGLLEQQSKFESFEMCDEITEYALSISGDDNKARMLFIGQTDGSTESLENVKHRLLKFRDYKSQFMRERGNIDEYNIAENMQIEIVDNFVLAVMNPHTEKSMAVMKEGTTLLTELMSIDIAI